MVSYSVLGIVVQGAFQLKMHQNDAFQSFLFLFFDIAHLNHQFDAFSDKKQFEKQSGTQKQLFTIIHC